MAIPFASRLALIAFATATLRGLLEGGDFRGTMWAALVALAAFYGLGLVLGDLARRLAEESARTELARMTDRRGESKSLRTAPEPT